MNLKEYLANDDPNKWWRLSSGEMENLFDEAMERNQSLVLALEKIKYMEEGECLSGEDAHDMKYIARQALANNRGEE